MTDQPNAPLADGTDQPVVGWYVLEVVRGQDAGKRTTHPLPQSSNDSVWNSHLFCASELEIWNDAHGRSRTTYPSMYQIIMPDGRIFRDGKWSKANNHSPTG